VSFAANEQWSLDRTVPGLDDHPARVAFREKLAELDPSITPADFLLARPQAALALLPRDFQWAGETFDDRFAFVGPCIGDRSFQGGWEPPAGAGPVVYVSLGTAMSNRPAVFRAAIEAVTGTPWHAVVSLGGLDPEHFGPLPPNVELHASVPQQAVLRHASVFVTHAGMGSTMEALVHDVPMVALPHSLEQASVAGRIAELGLGRDLGGGVTGGGVTGGGVTGGGQLREAIGAVLRSAAIRDAVRAMGATVRGAGGAGRAVDELEKRLTPGADRRPAARPGAGS
jgi:MGT family glycosyltransferase